MNEDRYEKIRDNIIKDIEEEKSLEKPDKKKLGWLAKQLIQHEEDACDFTGHHNDSKPKRKPSGKRCYKFGKWIKDDEQRW